MQELELAAKILVRELEKPIKTKESLDLVDQILRSDEFPVDYPVLPDGITTLMWAAAKAD